MYLNDTIRKLASILILLFAGQSFLCAQEEISKNDSIDFSKYSRYEIRQYLINIDDDSNSYILAVKSRKKLTTGIVFTALGTAILATGVGLGVSKLIKDSKGSADLSGSSGGAGNIAWGVLIGSPLIIIGLNKISKSGKHLDQAIAVYPD